MTIGKGGTVITGPGNTVGSLGGHQQHQAHTHDVSGNTGGQSNGHTHTLILNSLAGNNFSANRGPAWGSDDAVTGNAAATTDEPSSNHTHNFSVTSASDGGGDGGNYPPAATVSKCMVL